MIADYMDAPKRLSRIVLVKENQFLILNDRYKITYKHPKTFLLVWIVCKALKENKKFRDLGGIPSHDLCELCRQEGFTTSINSISTRWYDEVQLQRHEEFVFNLYDVINLKKEEAITLHQKWIVETLQLIFPEKVSPPKNSQMSARSKLYTVGADTEQILLYSTIREAMQDGYKESGVSCITPYRNEAGSVGFLDWAHKVEIDDSGSSSSTIRVNMINLSSTQLSHYMLPLWFDSPEEAAMRQVEAHLKDGTPLMVDILIGDENKTKKVEFLLRFPYPVETGDSIEFYYTYQAFNTYNEGKEYFEWFFGQPHTRYSVDLRFSKSWAVEYPTVFCGSVPDWFRVKKISPNHLRWIRYFPNFGKVYRIEYILKRVEK